MGMTERRKRHSLLAFILYSGRATTTFVLFYFIHLCVPLVQLVCTNILSFHPHCKLQLNNSSTSTNVMYHSNQDWFCVTSSYLVYHRNNTANRPAMMMIVKADSNERNARVYSDHWDRV